MAAHTKLVSSTPGAGATVTEPPRVVAIEFSEEIESSFGGMQLFDPTGARVPEVRAPTISGRRVELAIRPPSLAGVYRVVYRVLSQDGHPIESSFSWILQTVAPAAPVEPGPAPSTTTSTLAATSAHDGHDALAAPSDSAERLGWLARLGNYVSLTMLAGSVIVAWRILEPERVDVRRRLLTAGAISAVALAATAAALFIAALAVAAARPVGEVFAADLFESFAGTRFGSLLAGQLVIGLAAAVCCVAASKGKAPLILAVALTGAAAGATALWGHAGTDELAPLSVGVDWLHLAAVAAWVGGLVILIVLSARSEAPGRSAFLRFSVAAAWALVVVAATGTYSAIAHLGSPENLVDTRWGRSVLLKVLLFAGVALLGWRNRAALRRTSNELPVLRLLGMEAALMAAAFVVATQLATTEPADAEAASRVTTITAPFESGEIDVTIEPARVGTNAAHLYFFGEDGRLVENVRDARLQAENGSTTVTAELSVAGPGHFSALDLRLPKRGEWIIRIDAIVGGKSVSTTGAVVTH